MTTSLMEDRSMRRLPLLLSFIAAVSAVIGGPAVAQEYPTQSGTLSTPDADEDVTVEDGRRVVEDGEALVVEGGGFEPGATVKLTIESTPKQLAIATADASGWFSARVVIPPGFAAGSHTVKATGPSATGGVLQLALPVRVDDEEGTPGADSPWSARGGIGAGALVVGAAGAVGVRRRRHRV